MKLSYLTTALLTATLLASCGSSPTTRFYRLNSVATADSAAATAPYTIAINRVGIPDEVNTPQLVSHNGNRVNIDEFNRWSEPLNKAIPRVIAGNLTQLLPGARAVSDPQYVESDYNVGIDVQRFDAVLGEAATVELVWTVRPGKGGNTVTGHSSAREQVSAADYDALLAAYDRALLKASREIASSIQAAGAGK